MNPRSPRSRWAVLLLCVLVLGGLGLVGTTGAQGDGDPPSVQEPDGTDTTTDGTTTDGTTTDGTTTDGGAADGATTDDAAGDGDDPVGADGETGDDTEVGAGGQENVLRPLVRFLSASQSQLEEDTGLEAWLLYGIALVVAYFLVISIVLFIWRRARKPSFWKSGLEEVEGEGRWQCRVGYDIRRKVDAMLELKISKVEPSDATPQLACLVADTVKGRLSPGSTIKIGFPHTKPRSFWQTADSEAIGVGFELIQPRDKKVDIQLDCRVEYAIGRKKSTGGLFEVNLEFKPTTDSLGQPLQSPALAGLLDSDEVDQPVPNIDDTAKVKVLAASLAGEFSAPTQLSAQDEIEDLRRNQELLDQRLQLLESNDSDAFALPDGDASGETLEQTEKRILAEVGRRLETLPRSGSDAEIESVWRELQSLEQRLTQAVAQRLQDLETQISQTSSPADGALFQRALDDLEQRLTHDLAQRVTSGADGGGGAGAPEALKDEMRSLEQRLVSDLRENIQVLANSLRGLRTELTALNASVNDLMQRFVNIERRIAHHEERLEGLEGGSRTGL